LLLVLFPIIIVFSYLFLLTSLVFLQALALKQLRLMLPISIKRIQIFYI